jgi:hypothetical protein
VERWPQPLTALKNGTARQKKFGPEFWTKSEREINRLADDTRPDMAGDTRHFCRHPEFSMT